MVSDVSPLYSIAETPTLFFSRFQLLKISFDSLHNWLFYTQSCSIPKHKFTTLHQLYTKYTQKHASIYYCTIHPTVQIYSKSKCQEQSNYLLVSKFFDSFPFLTEFAKKKSRHCPKWHNKSTRNSVRRQRPWKRH